MFFFKVIRCKYSAKSGHVASLSDLKKKSIMWKVNKVDYIFV